VRAFICDYLKSYFIGNVEHLSRDGSTVNSRLLFIENYAHFRKGGRPFNRPGRILSGWVPWFS
jgi:hypothetical protein